MTHLNGVELPPPNGVSMLRRWRGGDATDHPPFWEHIGNAAMRDGSWKPVREYRQDWELYDLANDRSERHDLAGEHPERVTEMSAAWQRWADRIGVLEREDVLTARRAHGRFLGG